MDDKQLTDSDDSNDKMAATFFAQEEDLYTHSVDLTEWFSTGLTATGSFDLGIVAATQFGNLLDALPIPILMLDSTYTVVFANQACARISPNYKRIQGVPFTTLVPRSRNAEKAQWLVRKVFATRKPQVADGILEMEAKKIWGRLHFSAIRIGKERYVLLLIEDLTDERTQLLLTRRDDSQFQKARQELEQLVTRLTVEMADTKAKLARETQQHLHAISAFKCEKHKSQVLAELSPDPVALVSGAPTFTYVNHQFRVLFDYPGDDMPDLLAWWQRTDLPEIESALTLVAQLDAFAESDPSGHACTSCVFRKEDGREERFSLRVIKLGNRDYLLLC